MFTHTRQKLTFHTPIFTTTLYQLPRAYITPSPLHHTTDFRATNSWVAAFDN